MGAVGNDAMVGGYWIALVVVRSPQARKLKGLQID
jgi:hypothetical protein